MTNVIGQALMVGNENYVVVKQSRHRLELLLTETPLHCCRIQLGLTQQAMAKLLQISQASYSRLESGLVECPPDLLALANTALTNRNTPKI